MEKENSRLLTRQERDDCYKEWAQDENDTLFQIMNRKQAAKIASIIQSEATAYYAEKLTEAIERLRIEKDAECQQKIERIYNTLLIILKEPAHPEIVKRLLGNYEQTLQKQLEKG